MNIKLDAFYSINEVQKYVDWSSRKLQRYSLKHRLRKIDNRYLFTGKQLMDIIALDIDSKKTTTETTTVDTTIDTTVISLIHDINDPEYIKEVLTAIKQGSRLEKMSEEEYQRFLLRLQEANMLESRIIEFKEEISRMEEYVQDYRKNIEYLKKSLDHQQAQMTVVLQSITERNTLEAKEKGLI